MVSSGFVSFGPIAAMFRLRVLETRPLGTGHDEREFFLH